MRRRFFSSVVCRPAVIVFATGRFTAILSGTISLLFLQPQLFAQASTSAENKIKATFLFNFPQYVEWPTNAFAGPSSPFVIGIFGADPFGQFIDDLVRGEKMSGHSITIRRFESITDISSCHVLYVSATEARSIPAILQHLEDKPVLTVGESSVKFALRGGMIAFVPVGKKMRFRVNVAACDGAHLKVSSKLLRMAELVPAAAKAE